MTPIYIISVIVSLIVMIAYQFIDAKLNQNGSFSIPMAIMLFIFSLIPLFNFCAAFITIIALLIDLIEKSRFEINVNNIKFKK